MFLSQKILFQLSLLLLLHFSPLVLLSLAYTVPDKYFINCGASFNTTINDSRVFVGDQNSCSFSTGESEHVMSSNSSIGTPLLYQTARVYRQPCSYKFEINQNGTYLVRLHFFVFLSPANLSDALFNVSASGFLLLNNFSIRNSSSSPLIKEFLLNIAEGEFRIHFIPSQESSLAFVNAIEVFLAPESFITDCSPRVTSAGDGGNYCDLPYHVLHTIYRINVGGPIIEHDELWRKWIPDGSYLFNPPEAATNVSYIGEPEQVTKYIAPALVYQTARLLNVDNSSNSSFLNLSWSFPVTKNATHLVRVHLCDIVTKPTNGLWFPFDLWFNLSIYRNFGKRIDPYLISHELDAPFHFDFAVDSDDSGFLNVSIVPRQDSPMHYAFLNGLEIMEFMKESGSIPKECESKKYSCKIKESNKNHSSKCPPVVIVLVSSGAFVIMTIVVVLGLKCRKGMSDQSSAVLLYGGTSYNKKLTERSVNASLPPNLNLSLRISFAEIKYATKNFDAKFLVGEGGFGKVYKGTLRSGMKVAVKRSEPGHGQGLKEFQTEIIILSQIRHRHLVSLIGYCDEGSELILVYEFMEKGSLRDQLYHSNGNPERSSSRFELSWKQRLEICIGAARGLHYLHTGPAGGIIHHDVKSTNILLNENYVAKVGDFGLSKSGLSDPDHFTMGVKGSFGYLDPEYFKTLRFTEKSDVYSFGVVLLEVLCARPAVDNSLLREEASLAEWGMLWQRKGQLEKIIDPLLLGKIKASSLKKFAEISEKCLKAKAAERPDMHEVLWDLTYALQLQEITIDREPHEDGSTNTSLELQLPVICHLPSTRTLIEEDDDAQIKEDDGSNTTASEV
uniref:Protein kinase domain-containing protein n=1 Tax=Quercus lobata TaxID=97700 RepID=A0A7N2R0U7_QUELO